MKFNLNLLPVFAIVVPATLAVPAPNDEVSVARDIAKRESPVLFQDILFHLRAFESVLITLHFVWNCAQRRLSSRTRGAGSTWNEQRGANPNQQTITAHPNGIGVITYTDNLQTDWNLNGETVSVDMQASVDDNNNLILQAGTWIYNFIARGLTATNDDTHETTPVEFVDVTTGEQYYADSSLPPRAEGLGFSTDSDDSVDIQYPQ